MCPVAKEAKEVVNEIFLAIIQEIVISSLFASLAELNWSSEAIENVLRYRLNLVNCRSLSLLEHLN